MIKNKIKKKVLISSLALFTLFLIYIIPNNKYDLKPKEEVEYTLKDVKTNNIYLLDHNNLLGRTSVIVNYDSTVDRAYELLDVLIKDGVGESLVPSGFTSVLPSDTSVISIEFEDSTMYVNFSKEFLSTNKDQEVINIESVVYTLTELDDVKNIVLYVEGEQLTKLPLNNLVLPTLLNRNYGINKEYDITSLSNINHVTVYYIDKYNDNYYYVPVTKYMNDDREKIKIIIDELSSNKVYNSDLMSFLNSNTELLSAKTENDILNLTFNSYILNDFDKKDILEEVIYTICLSIKDNYDVKEVVFNVDDQEIYKKVLKSIE